MDAKKGRHLRTDHLFSQQLSQQDMIPDYRPWNAKTGQAYGFFAMTLVAQNYALLQSQYPNRLAALLASRSPKPEA